MNSTINPTMITLAREARGFTQQELADKTNTQKAYISKVEHGELGVNESLLESISEATAYPKNFFYQPGAIMPMNLSYRKRVKVPAKILTPIEAKINIIRNHVQLLTRALDKQSPLIATFTVDDENTPAAIAGQVRKVWNIKSATINNLTSVLEKQGIAISLFDFGTERVDSRMILTDDRYPIIVLNNNLLGDRQRFSLAFELGHLIMHTYSTVPLERDISREANLFAAELLMPANEIVKDFEGGITIPLLGELKRKWKVSMIALLYRADDLGLLSANQKRYLLQQFNQLSIRRREPSELDVIKEEPQLIRQWIAEYCKRSNLSIIDMAAILALGLDEFIELYN